MYYAPPASPHVQPPTSSVPPAGDTFVTKDEPHGHAIATGARSFHHSHACGSRGFGLAPVILTSAGAVSLPSRSSVPRPPVPPSLPAGHPNSPGQGEGRARWAGPSRSPCSLPPALPEPSPSASMTLRSRARGHAHHALCESFFLCCSRVRVCL